MMAYILVILPSTYSPTSPQREDYILESIFLIKKKKKSKHLKTSIENVCELILKGKIRVHQLARIDPSEMVVLLMNTEITSYCKK